jgi:hypothetical protein
MAVATANIATNGRAARRASDLKPCSSRTRRGFLRKRTVLGGAGSLSGPARSAAYQDADRRHEHEKATHAQEATICFVYLRGLCFVCFAGVDWGVPGPPIQ